tara:strand:- start:347 stop:622 length:276 start_codon:yes stop_codon:yes gene_type:complete
MKQFKTIDVTTLGFTEVTYSQVRENGSPVEKYIDLYNVEHLAQFMDLLQEAGYRHQTKEEYKSPFLKEVVSEEEKFDMDYPNQFDRDGVDE